MGSLASFCTSSSLDKLVYCFQKNMSKSFVQLVHIYLHGPFLKYGGGSTLFLLLQFLLYLYPKYIFYATFYLQTYRK